MTENLLIQRLSWKDKIPKRKRILAHSADNSKTAADGIETGSKDMAKLTVTTAKKQIIKQIKKRGGLFENCGQKELRQLQKQNENLFWDDKCEKLNQWIESLDYSTVQQYL